MNLLILGVGQSMRGDDAAGLEAVRRWQAAYPKTAARLRVELSEAPGPGLLDLFTGMDAVLLVDALRSGDAPGSLRLVGPDELAAFTAESRSVHGWGLAETLQLGYTLYPTLKQARISLIGIVGGDFTLGAGLSPEVENAMTRIPFAIEQRVQGLLKR